MKDIKIICEWIADRFKTDPTVPGVQIAKIDRGWYVAIHRYTETLGEGKYVYARGVDIDFDRAVLKMVSDLQRSAGIKAGVPCA